MGFRESIQNHLEELAKTVEDDLQKEIQKQKQYELERTRAFKAKAARNRQELQHKERLKNLLASHRDLSSITIDSDDAAISDLVKQKIRDKQRPVSVTATESLPEKIAKALAGKATPEEPDRMEKVVVSPKEYLDVQVIRTADQSLKDLENFSMDQIKELISHKDGQSSIDMTSESFLERLSQAKSNKTA